MGATDLVLRMIEAGAVLWDDLVLDNPIRAIREVSHDMTGRSRIRLANGRATALEIQHEYLNRAKDFTRSNGLDAISKRVLDMERGRWGRSRPATWT